MSDNLIRYAGFDPTHDRRKYGQRKRTPYKPRVDLDIGLLRRLEAEGVLRIHIAAQFGVSPTCIRKKMGLKTTRPAVTHPAWWAAAHDMAGTVAKATIARRLGVSPSAVRYALIRLASARCEDPRPESEVRG